MRVLTEMEVQTCVPEASFFFPNRLTKVSIFSVSLPDVDECSLQTHTCWNHSVCVNLPGGYDCVCASGPGCSGDCQQDAAVRRNGEDWKPSYDRCALCSCKVAHVWTHAALLARCDSRDGLISMATVGKPSMAAMLCCLRARSFSPVGETRRTYIGSQDSGLGGLLINLLDVENQTFLPNEAVWIPGGKVLRAPDEPSLVDG